MSKHVNIKIVKHRISEILAVAAMILLLIHIADGSMERAINHGFLPVGVDRKPFGISNFGISSIILFFIAIGLDVRNKNKDASNITKILIIVGGAIIGTTTLGVSMMDKNGGWIVKLFTISVTGYVIMGLGVLRASLMKDHLSIDAMKSYPYLIDAT